MASLMLGTALGWAGQARASAADLYYERSVAVAAQSRCHMFEPRVAAALTAGMLQARGAALRSGVDMATLAASSARARSQASQYDCGDARLRLMASRVQAGFTGWSRAARITFAGDRAHWYGDRFQSKDAGWRLSQEALIGRSPVKLGLIGRSPTQVQLGAVVSFAGRNRPYAARLVMRNTEVQPRPWLTGDGLPPPSARTSLFAQGVKPAPASLLKAGQKQGEQWQFNGLAAEALARLDPRENVRIEFLFRDDSVAVAEFEVGDFAAGRAFLGMGPI